MCVFFKNMILYIAQSIDGYIADDNNSLDWLMKYNDIILESREEIKNSYPNFIKNIDVIVYGKKTYSWLMQEINKNPYQDNYDILISNNKVEDDTISKQCNLEEFLSLDLKNKNIWIVGGSSIILQLMELDLINEMIITTIPEIIGGGIKLFQTNKKTTWKLQKTYNDNSIIECHYVKENYVGSK